MKTFYILMVVLGLQMNTLFAGNISDGEVLNSNKTLFPDNSVLLPVRPTEADFSDAVQENTVNVPRFITDTPPEASFEEDPGLNPENFIKNAMPLAPTEADFENLV